MFAQQEVDRHWQCQYLLCYDTFVSMERPIDQKRIALRLLELRLAAELSQEDLAEALGTGQSAYSELESGHVKLSAVRAMKLADFYGITVDELLRGSGSGQRTADSGQRTADSGQRTADSGREERGRYGHHRGIALAPNDPGDRSMKRRSTLRCIIIAGPNGTGKTTFARCTSFRMPAWSISSTRITSQRGCRH